MEAQRTEYPYTPLSTVLCENKKCKSGRLRASGIYAVTTKRGATTHMKLCAACGLHGIANRVMAFYSKRTDSLMFVKDVKKVSLIKSI